MNDKFEVAAHVGDDITGSMLDMTGTLKPWTAPEGSLMEEVSGTVSLNPLLMLSEGKR